MAHSTGVALGFQSLEQLLRARELDGIDLACGLDSLDPLTTTSQRFGAIAQLSCGLCNEFKGLPKLVEAFLAKHRFRVLRERIEER